jgi:hypothetical protein
VDVLVNVLGLDQAWRVKPEEIALVRQDCVPCGLG